jgi:Fe-S cluster biogenesis protein NfuA
MTIEEQIKYTLDKIRPFLQRDGGDVEFHSFEDGIVYVTMKGACEGCMMIDDTLGSGIKIILQEEVPGVIDVKLASEKPITIEDELKYVDELLKQEQKEKE